MKFWVVSLNHLETDKVFQTCGGAALFVCDMIDDHCWEHADMLIEVRQEDHDQHWFDALTEELPE